MIQDGEKEDQWCARVVREGQYAGKKGLLLPDDEVTWEQRLWRRDMEVSDEQITRRSHAVRNLHTRLDETEMLCYVMLV